MTYLLIAFVLAIILSPVMWFRQSPRQKLITDMRKEAREKKLWVKLSMPADAREGEGRLECVTYTLAWVPDSNPSMEPRMEKWLLVTDTLLQGTLRGDPSPWENWQWLGRESNESLNASIGLALEQLPKSITALEACSEGVRIYWQERGELHDVQVIFDQLSKLRNAMRH